MKATYQKPETLIARISTVQMIAGSKLGPVEDGFSTGSAPELGEGVTSGNLSRRSIWDDEEEDF